MTNVKTHSIKHRVEYALFCFWGTVFSIAPYHLALLLGWVVAWIGHYLLRYRVKKVHGRIREVFPTLKGRQVRHIAWISWRNFVFNMVDTFRLRRIDEDWMRRYVVDFDRIAAALRDQTPPGGFIGVSLHMGSAEVLAVCLQQLGMKVFVITGKQKNLLVDDKLNAMRRSTGIDCIPKSAGASMFKQVFRRLKEGGMLTMLVDLRQPTGGVDIDFLGGRASVVPGMGLFAKKTGVPVIASVFSRKGWSHHRLELFPTLFPDATLSVEEDVQRMTQIVFDRYDRAIRECPEQWFWYNKNWILAPLRQPTLPVPESQSGGAS